MILLALAACAPRETAPTLGPPVDRRPIGALARAPHGLPDLTVDCAGGGDFLTIQAAIDAAPNRSWIEVLPCTYQERIDYGGKTLWISSTGGPAVTELDAQNNGPAVRARQGEGDGTAFVGFTIEDGQNPAVDVEMSALRLQDVVIVDSAGSYTVRSTSGDLELVDVTIDGSNQGNSFQVYVDRGALSAKRLSIACNNGSGLFSGHGAFIVDGSTIACPGGRAFEGEHSVGRLQRSSVEGDIETLAEEDHPDDLVRIWNTAVEGHVEAEFGTLSLRNVIVTGQVRLTTTGPTVEIENSVFLSPTCAIDSDSVLGPVRNNDFAGGASQCNGVDLVGVDGNVSVAPMFVNAGAGDLHLQAGSPLVDAGVAESAYDDVDGSTNDIGIYGGKFTQDGGW